MILGKNIPSSLLLRHLCPLLIGQLALLIQYRRPLDSLIGYLSFLGLIPHVMRERRRIHAASKLSDQEIERLLDPSPEGVCLPRWLLEMISEGVR